MTQNRSQSGAAAMFRALKRPAQARLSLFCFPHGGGGATSYQAWVDELPDDVALYAYAPPGRGPRLRDPAHASLTEAAEAAARMLCAEHAELLTGAFALFGHSVGALLAFETARALEARGAPPPALVGLSGHAAPALASRAARTAHLDDDALFEEIRALGGLPDVAPDEEAQLRELVLAPTRADFRLAEAHHIAPETQLAAPLALFAGADDEAASPQAMEGWRKHSSNVSAAYCFAGGHFFTETACAEVVATLLLGVAQAIQARPRSILRGPAEPAPIEMGLDELFERQAAASPDATALVGADRTLTYRELDEEADLLAAELIARGVQTDRIVALFLETSADFMVGYIAALKAGGAYLQLDIRAPEATLAGALDKAAPIAILTRPDLIDKLPDAWRGKAVALGPGWAMRLANAGRRPPPRERRRSCGQDLAYAVMTSGTTGAPKAILCPHQGAVISYDWRYTHLPYGPNEREGCNVFLVWEALRPLLRGAECRLIPDDVIYDPPRLAAFLAEHRITRMLFTPSLLEQFLAGDEDLAALTPELKLILLNGEVVTSALLARARARLPQARIVNDYSISETHDVGHIDLTDLELSRGRFAPAGRVMSNVAVYILDCDALEAGRYEPTPWGVAGEIFVGGPTIARGYLGDEAQTAERFLPDAFSAAPGARMFRTGDLGRFTPDGALEISGRAKFMIKLRGYSVVPSAIEATAAELDEVAAAALVPVLDPATSQPESLALFAAPSVGRMIDVEQLRAHLAASLPHYAVPAQIELLPALPVDPRTGKLDRKKLPKPTPRARKEAAELEARSNRGDSDVAAKLAQLWAEILGRPPEQADANFFELGGHSLAAARLARRIETAFGRQMRVVDLFDAPTLAAQAALLAVEKAKAPAELRGGGARGGADRDIAILSLAGRFPGASSVDALWRNLLSGRCAIRDLTDEELTAAGAPLHRPDFVRSAAVVEDADQFDPRFFGLSDREAELMDPQQRLFLECAREALEAGGYAPGQGAAVGVYAGCYLPSYLLHALGGAAALDPHDPTAFHLAEIGNDKDYLATRAAYLLGLSGPTLSIQTSCSTGLTAIAEAVFALRAGRCEMAIAGASSLSFPRTGYVHIDGHLTSASGVGRAFDSRADGAILGETVGAVLLKPLAQAQADGDPILAVIKGAAVNNDGGAKAGYSAPSVSGQAEVIQLALDDAGVSADTISYVEAHGTGTPVGDPIEVAALTRAFRRDTARTGYCALGSIKPNIGHGNIAAGFSGLAKAAMMLAHRRQPPMIGYEQPNPELRLEETPFHIATEPREWPEGASPRRAGVSSFGIGGANAHVILEEAPRQTEREEAGDGAQLFPLSARSETALARLADDIVHRFDAEDPPALDDASHTLRAGREAMPVRASFVVRSRADIRAACAKLIPTRAGLDAGAVWLFPGNGAQHPMMGADLYAAYPAYRQRFEHCRELFAGLGLPDLGDLYAPERSAALLTSAAGAQSALFAVELSLAALYESVGARPAAIVGHSLGEYAAWVAAGALSLEDGARLVAVRAAATDQAPEGGMMAVSADAAAVEALCRADAELVVAARNAPTEWTLSGPSASIEAALRGAEAVGASARRLRVQRAFHSPAMAAAAAALAQAGREVEMRSPTVPLASSLTGRWFDPHEVAASDYWSAQMRQPVLFADAFACALGRASAAVIEVGPGPSLAGLSAKNGGPVALRSLRRAGAEADHDDNVFLTTAGKLWAMGAPIELAKLHPQGRAPHRASMPTTPFDRRRIWPAAPVAPQPRRQGLIFTRPTWARAEAPAPTSAVGEWLILSSAASEPLAIALSEALRSRGALVRRGSDDLTELSSINARAAADPLNILDLTNATPEIAPPLEALTQLVERLQRVAAAMTPMVYWRVGAGALAVGLEEAQPDAAAALGPLLVAGQEHAMLGVRHIDLTPAEAARPSPRLCDQILRELLAGAPRREPFVALRGGRIWGERFEEVDPTAAQAAGVALLRQGGAHIITGGLGRIGLALTRRLAEHGAPVIVTTRRAPPDDWTEAGGSFAALAKLRESGANIRVVQLDLTRPEQVSALLRDVAVSGTGLGGVFHAAGLADLKYLPETDRMSLAAELASKRGGLQALNAAIETQRRNSGATPAFVMLFSSLAATLGGLGMAGYMAANRYMDAWVEAAADSESESGHPSPRWISVNWDDWDFDYGKEQVGAYARSRADLAMAPEAALNALEAILGDPTANRIAVSGSPIAERARDWLENASRILDAPSVQSPPSPAKRDMPAWLNPTETAVAAAYAAVLGAAELQPEDDFFDLGGDSLMATRIVMMLRRSLENAPPPAIADIFDYPTVRGLAARLEARAE